MDIPGSVFEPIILYLLKSFSPPFPLDEYLPLGDSGEEIQFDKEDLSHGVF